jgi:NAD(P)-dependent dehydrogenase (short-subunit alcohol dehydrogenase family)
VPLYERDAESNMNIVITGSTRGIGLGLATEFLVRGHKVLISSRNPGVVNDVVETLSDNHTGDVVFGYRCDVTLEAEVDALWTEARRVFDTVDIWINNAGRNNPKQRIQDMPLTDVEGTLRTNLIGMIYGSVIALRGMQHQGSGWIFNMEGFGSEGMIGVDQVPYGLSKYALRYFTKALVKTVAGTPVNVGYLSPGIVTTEMAVPPLESRSEFFDKNKKILNILADHVETVTPWLVEQILSTVEGQKKNGTAIRWMSTPKVAWRFFSSLFRRRTVIEDAIDRLDNPH